MPREALRRIADRIPPGAIALAGVSLLNVVLGFGREVTIAYYFGASAEVDAFLVGLAIPQLLVVNVAQISVAVVLPLYVGYREGGKQEEATALVQKWLLLVGLVLAVAAGLLYAAAGPVVGLIAPGLSAEGRADAAGWLRLLLPYVWLMGTAGTFKVVLDSEQRFVGPQLARGLVSVCVIVACGLLAETLGVGALTTGFVAGGMLGFGLQLVLARRYQARLPGLPRRDLQVSLPVAAGSIMAFQSLAPQLDVLIDRAFASTLSPGSIAAYGYALAINSVPSVVVTSALATALFPILARAAAQGRMDDAFATARRWVLFLFAAGLLPILLLVLFRQEIVSLIFQRGSFDRQATELTASVLTVLPWMMFLTGASAVLVRLLLVQQRQLQIAAIAFAAVSVKLGLSWALVGRWGLLGLASATVGAAAFGTTLRFALARVGVRGAPPAA